MLLEFSDRKLLAGAALLILQAIVKELGRQTLSVGLNQASSCQTQLAGFHEIFIPAQLTVRCLETQQARQFQEILMPRLCCTAIFIPQVLRYTLRYPSMRPVIALAKRSVAFAWLLFAAGANASVGLVEVPAKSDAEPITIFYPSRSQAASVRRGAFEFEAAENGTPAPANGRLVVISHGSPASPWVYSDLARTLVEAGFVVVMPEHFADNYKDDSEPGPPSWRRRPLEVSRSIDTIAADPRFGPMLKLDKVGMYGMSAGGHTALTLAGGRWSPARLRQHCQANIAEDFQACAGLSMRLTGGLLDRLKITLVRAFVSAKLTDDTWYGHTDPRIVAIVAGVPFAADFDPASLQAPPVSLGIVTARQDKWLIPKFHSDAILKACSSCEQLGSLPTGGHGALLSPLPPARTGLVAELISDPPGFDRAASVPEVNRTISAFFVKHLLSGGSGR